jgi:hypothetical protein
MQYRLHYAVTVQGHIVVEADSESEACEIVRNDTSDAELLHDAELGDGTVRIDSCRPLPEDD